MFEPQLPQNTRSWSPDEAYIWISSSPARYRYLSGEENIKEYASSDDLKRVFCGNCGSNILVSLNDVPEILYLSMGAIDGNPTHPEAYHIYVGSKAPWHEITDGSVQYDEAPPEL